MIAGPRQTLPVLDPAKFRDPEVTVQGKRRASVALRRLETLWFNTGTLCNIECVHCYIESSPRNDRLEYITRAEVAAYLDEIAALDLPTREIGFTGGEPFLNLELAGMMEDALLRGFEVLVLTNAMQPMMRLPVREALLRLRETYGDRITLRISIDHYTREYHDAERGPDSFDTTLRGVRWLVAHAFHLSVAGRTRWDEEEVSARDGYRRLFTAEEIPVDANDPSELLLFPEMDATVDVPEITSDCWSLLDVDPNAMMCATSRMVVKRKGAETPAVIACTLLPYEPQFELGGDLEESLDTVQLNHPHCAKFCVLGRGSCSVSGERSA
jgi:uncharacterized Fe-S cluster-containing radical SAM superfamily protein